MSHDPVSGIQRWECYDNHEIGKDDDGDYVTYADAEQAQAKAQAESYARGQRDERDRIVTYLRDNKQMPSSEAQAWAYGFAEVVETGAFNGAAREEKP